MQKDVKKSSEYFYPPHKISLRPLTCLALGGLASIGLMVAAKPATALTTGFQSEYAPANWTLTNTNADGSVNTAAAPTSISLTGGNNGRVLLAIQLPHLAVALYPLIIVITLLIS